MEILEILWNGLSDSVSGLWTGSGDILNILGTKGKELTDLAGVSVEGIIETGKQALEILVK